MDYRYMYLRDRNKRPVGCVVIKLDEDNKLINYQLSVVNPVDSIDRFTNQSLAFNREHACNLALGRLITSPLQTKLPRNPNMNTISAAVMQAIRNGSGLPTRAREAARLWLKAVPATK